MPQPRNLTKKILTQLKRHEIIFLLGTRQTGKTTLTRLVADGAEFGADTIFFFDLEDKAYRSLFDTVSIQLLKNIFKLEGVTLDQPALLIFDEIQLLEDPANLFKLLHDHFPKFRIIATGSSSLRIKHKFSDSLSGRKRVFHVEPLSFDEFLVFKGEDQLVKIRSFFNEGEKDAVLPLVKTYHAQFLQLFEEYLIYGGYPEVVLTDGKHAKVEKLDSIASAYIQKDIREFGRIDNIDGYNNLLKYISVNLGAQFNLTSAQSTIGLSAQTVKKYISLLQETFIIKELPPYFVNKNKEISKTKKIFFKDNGIRNLQIKNFHGADMRPDIGALYENYVFNVLDQEKDILTNNYFYRTQAKTEIDFVVCREHDVKLVEVKSGAFNRPIKAMKEFEKKYQKTTGKIKKIVVNKSHLNETHVFVYVPAYLL
jgi:hypothetical protein